MKRCSKCKRFKQESEFWKDKLRPDGLCCACKECLDRSNKKWSLEHKYLHREMIREWYRKNKERYSEYNARFKEKHPGRINELARQRTALNPEAAREKWRAKYKRNSYSAVQRSLRWCKNHPEEKRLIDARRYARKKGAIGKYIVQDIHELLLKQKGECLHCRKDIHKTYTIDHIMPLSLGGTNFPINLQLLCRSCNSRKGNRIEVSP